MRPEKPGQYSILHSDGAVGTAFWDYDDANDDFEWVNQSDVAAWMEM